MSLYGYELGYCSYQGSTRLKSQVRQNCGEDGQLGTTRRNYSDFCRLLGCDKYDMLTFQELLDKMTDRMQKLRTAKAVLRGCTSWRDPFVDEGCKDILYPEEIKVNGLQREKERQEKER